MELRITEQTAVKIDLSKLFLRYLIKNLALLANNCGNHNKKELFV